MLRSSLVIWLIAIGVGWIFTTQATDNTCQSIPFRHPYANDQKNLSSEEVYASYRGFCLTYPRCLAFNCCDKELAEHVSQVHETAHCSHFAPFQCLIPHRSCSYVSFPERISNLPILHETLTPKKLYDDLLGLTPTSPQLFRALEHRCEFRVLYLIQGDDRQTAAPFVTRSGADFLFLSYKTRYPGALYFPKCIFSEGRMALYLAARQLEEKQGWLYDYFVFMDDDPTVVRGSLSEFESFLNRWRPAVGVPAYDGYESINSVHSLVHADMVMMAYHREAVEILMQWMNTEDRQCIWSSQMMQMTLQGSIYRNHLLATSALVIANPTHRDYPKNCLQQGTGFLKVFSLVQEWSPKSLAKCSPTKFQSGYYGQGAPAGKVHPKLLPYHLMFANTSHLPVFNQDLCNFNAGQLGFADPKCCSVDSVLYAHYGTGDSRYVTVPMEDGVSGSVARHYLLLHDHAYSISDAMLADVTQAGIAVQNISALDLQGVTVIPSPRRHCPSH